jgi:hypothetical protein
VLAATDALAGARWPVDALSPPDVDGLASVESDESDSDAWRPRPDAPMPGRRDVVVASGSS